MNGKNIVNVGWQQLRAKAMLAALTMAMAVAPLNQSAIAAEPRIGVATADNTLELAPQINLTIGKSTLVKVPTATEDIIVGGSCPGRTRNKDNNPPVDREVWIKSKKITEGDRTDQVIQGEERSKPDKCVVEVDFLDSETLYLLGTKVGGTNIIIVDKTGRRTVVDVNVSMDSGDLQRKIVQFLPGAKDIRVSIAGESVVLSGTAADAMQVNRAVELAEAYVGKSAGSEGSKVINLVRVAAPQQVMLEVKMAEVSKNILDKLGAQLGASRANAGISYAIAAGFLSLTGANPLSPGGLITITKGSTSIKVDAENKDGVVKILAEPNIMAISGQEGSFLAGGKVLIPVAQASASGSSSITLEEKEFGVGLRFTPTVLEDDVINLRVAPEVSELSQTGTAVSIGSTSSVLPSFTTRRASTTVQLRDGQSFAIAGLIKNNVTESVRRFPILGDIPILGALFRSTEFQNDKTELLFVITPHLVKPLPPDYALPTDSFKEPSKKELFLEGKMEGAAGTETTAPANAPQGDASGFELK